jgi:hypothetical protein
MVSEFSGYREDGSRTLGGGGKGEWFIVWDDEEKKYIRHSGAQGNDIEVCERSGGACIDA